MEYSSPLASLLGVAFGLVWSAGYFQLFKSPELQGVSGKAISRFNLTRVLIYIVGISGISLLAYALAGPRKPLKYAPSNIEVNDIYFVVDVSVSMRANDLKPNRLEVAKEQLRQFAALRPTDRMGIIMFSEKVFTLLPLTTDPALVDRSIADIRMGFLGSGTNIGDALALGVARAQASDTKNKVIILLTDGVNNVGNMPPLQAAKEAKKYGIKVYTIGIGASKGGKIPNANGRGIMFQKIPGGSIDVKTLRDISEMTGGENFMAGSKDSLRQILDDIQKLEKTKIKSQKQMIYDELYYFYLFWGVLLFIVSELLKRFFMREVE